LCIANAVQLGGAKVIRLNDRGRKRSRLIGEGLVSKRRDRAYRGGRCLHWVKVKNPNSPAMKRAAEVDWVAMMGYR
jgi:ATP-dependent DNA ligase